MTTLGSCCNRTNVGFNATFVALVEVEDPLLTFEDVQCGPAQPPTFQSVEKSLRIEE